MTPQVARLTRIPICISRTSARCFNLCVWDWCMKHECKVHKTGMGLKPRTLTPVGLQSWLIVLLLEVQAGVVSCCPTPCTRQFQGYTKDIQCEDFCKISAPCYILVSVFFWFLLRACKFSAPYSHRRLKHPWKWPLGFQTIFQKLHWKGGEMMKLDSFYPVWKQPWLQLEISWRFCWVRYKMPLSSAGAFHVWVFVILCGLSISWDWIKRVGLSTTSILGARPVAKGRCLAKDIIFDVIISLILHWYCTDMALIVHW